MKKFLVRVAALAAVSVAASCGPLFGETPGTIMPAPPPQPPEPVLVRSGPVFAYDTGNGVLAAITGPDAVQHEVLLDHVAVRVRTPPGWVSSQAGYAVWFQSENESSRFVVYPVANHGAEFHELWYDRDLHDPAVRVSPLQSCDSS